MLRALTDQELLALLAVPGPLQFLFAAAPWTGSGKSRVFCSVDMPGGLVFFTVVFAPTAEARVEWEIAAKAEMFLSAFAQHGSQLAVVTKLLPLSSDQPSQAELADKTHTLLAELSPFVESVCSGVPLDTTSGDHATMFVAVREPPPASKLHDPSLN